jgi:hypothetical protein
MTVVISTRIVPTHRNRVYPFEAWQYKGQPFEKWPDWVRSKYADTPLPTHLKPGMWALRDDEGYMWRWMANESFDAQYEPLP